VLEVQLLVKVFSVSADNIGNIFVTGGFYNNQGNWDSTIIFNIDTLIDPPNYTEPMFIVKYDANGNVLCASSLLSGGDDVIGVVTDRFGNAYVGGDFYITPFTVGRDTLKLGVAGAENVFVAKFTCSNTTGISQYSGLNTEISIYPNPSNGTISITSLNNIDEIKVTNMLGQTIYETKPRSVNTTLALDNTGVYFITLTSGTETSTKKVIVSK
jgi:hypothetical protein